MSSLSLRMAIRVSFGPGSTTLQKCIPSLTSDVMVWVTGGCNCVRSGATREDLSVQQHKHKQGDIQHPPIMPTTTIPMTKHGSGDGILLHVYSYKEKEKTSIFSVHSFLYIWVVHT